MNTPEDSESPSVIAVTETVSAIEEGLRAVKPSQPGDICSGTATIPGIVSESEPELVQEVSVTDEAPVAVTTEDEASHGE